MTATGETYHHLGAHPETRDGVNGVRFAVWAPNATEVCVLTDANGWRHGDDCLTPSDSGVWSGFLPGVGEGTPYKYGLRTRSDELLQKADPFAFAAEVRPRTASLVHFPDGYQWNDADWIAQRNQTDWLRKPVAIYEVHAGSWKRPPDGNGFPSYRELAHQLVEYVQELGYTHIELMPMTEFPYDPSWGYQVTGYFAPTSRFGTPDDFRYFVDHCHSSGIGVIMDWVPAHFPVDAHGLAEFDGTCLYEHADPRKGFHPDWKTNIFNFGRFEVCDFLHSSARFWLDEYHIDGLRVDAVASMLYLDYSRQDGEWEPNSLGGNENLEAIEFLRQLSVQIHNDFPGTMLIAEESTAWNGVSRPVDSGGLGFSMKWDMGWMHDSLNYLAHDPVHRRHHQNQLSFRSLYAFSENFVLPLSHDEVVHGKGALISRMPGDDWQRFANLRLLYGYQYTMPGKKLLFMGGEFGQEREWDCDGQLQWELLSSPLHDGISRLTGDLNRLYCDYPALHELDCAAEGFDWIDADDSDHSTYSYCRKSENGQLLVVVMNCTPVARHGYRIGVPRAGRYLELLNTDAGIYGGSGVGNLGEVQTADVTCHGHADSLSISLPPLGMLVLKHSTES